MIKKNIVLGVALGYNLDHLRNFVCSFRSFNKIDDVSLFIDPNINDDLKMFFAHHNVQILYLKNQEFADTLIHNRRFIEYLDFLSTTNHNQVLLTDTRDVIFQGNPFRDSTLDFLNLFLEDSGNTIGNCRFNSFWIEAAYGDLGKEKLFPQLVICCGTILGTHSEIIKYLKKYKQELIRIRSQRPDVYSSVTVDQSIANYIGHISSNDLNIEIKPNGDLVGTIGVSMCSDQALDQIIFKNGLISVNDLIPPVIHQYDRSQLLVNFYSMKYSKDINLTSSVK